MGALPTTAGDFMNFFNVLLASMFLTISSAMATTAPDTAGTPGRGDGGLAQYWWIVLIVLVAAAAFWYFTRRNSRPM